MRTFLVDGNQKPIDMQNYNPNPNSTSPLRVVNYNLPGGYNFYDVTFHSDTVHTLVTSRDEIVDQWISDTLYLHKPHPFIIALHLEFRPNNQAATLNLCVDHRCVIFQIGQANFLPSRLPSFLSDPRHTFIGVDINDHVARLLQNNQLHVANTVDLRSLAADVLGDPAMMVANLNTLAQNVLGKEVEKPEIVARSRWDHLHLTTEQVKYAVVDTFACFEIGRRLYCNNMF